MFLFAFLRFEVSRWPIRTSLEFWKPKAGGVFHKEISVRSMLGGEKSGGQEQEASTCEASSAMILSYPDSTSEVRRGVLECISTGIPAS